MLILTEERIIQEVFTHAETRIIIRTSEILFTRLTHKKASRINAIFIESEDKFRLLRNCKGINFWTNNTNHSLRYGPVITILPNHLWKGGTPSLNKINTPHKRLIAVEEKISNIKYAPKKKTEAIVWEIKYFILSSDEKKESPEASRGKTAIMFISNLTQINKMDWVDSAIKILLNIISQNPAIGVKNIIGAQK